MNRFIPQLAVSFSVLLGAASAFAGNSAVDTLVDLKKPNGAPLRYLTTTSSASIANVGVILFAGAQGQVHLNDGVPNPGSNFLVRSRALFAEEGLAVAVFDPSPEVGSLSDRARMSADHAQEVETVLTDFKRRTGVTKVYLVGTSRGTISAAYLANQLQSQVAGVVLTSTLFKASKAGAGLSGFDFSSIKQPVLFVHNTDDQCKNTPPSYAKNLANKFPVVWISGSTSDEDDSCGPFSAHGYMGHEKEAVHAIADWILRSRPNSSVDAGR